MTFLIPALTSLSLAFLGANYEPLEPMPIVPNTNSSLNIATPMQTDGFELTNKICREWKNNALVPSIVNQEISDGCNSIRIDYELKALEALLK